MKGLALICMDGLDIDLVRRYDMTKIHKSYIENGNLFTCSSYPHTMTSWILMTSGELKNLFWVRNNSHRWIDPARRMDHEGDKMWKVDDEDIEIITYEDLKNKHDLGPFIWEIAEKRGLTPRIQEIPLTLPPFSHNAEEKSRAWFPNLEEQQEVNLEDKWRITMDSLGDLADGKIDLYITSIPGPDKYLHSIGEGLTSEEFGTKMIKKLDGLAEDIIEFCRENDIGYVICGDHGAPGPDGPKFGEFPEQKIKVVRHRKHSAIFGNIEPLPRYTGDMFGWMVHQLNVEVE